MRTRAGAQIRDIFLVAHVRARCFALIHHLPCHCLCGINITKLAVMSLRCYYDDDENAGPDDDDGDVAQNGGMWSITTCMAALEHGLTFCDGVRAQVLQVAKEVVPCKRNVRSSRGTMLHKKRNARKVFVRSLARTTTHTEEEGATKS